MMLKQQYFMTEFAPCIFDSDSPNLAEVINSTNVGIWEYEPEGQKTTWSAGLFKILGYQPGKIECSYDNFINYLLYFNDKKRFLEAVNSTKPTSVIDLQLFTSTGYKWFQCTLKKQTGGMFTGTFVNIHKQKQLERQTEHVRQSVAETNHLVKLATWEIEVATSRLQLSAEAFDIIELREATEITIEELVSFYEPEHRPILARDINACSQYGRPFDVDLKLRTVKNNIIWVKTKAMAKMDDLGRCVAIKGIIQDIKQTKQHESQLTSSLKMARRQNKRLQNFAHVVSHNLRAYAGNLQSMISFYDEANNPAERDEVFGRIKTIGDNLSTTIANLNEVVKVEFEINTLRTWLTFDQIFKSVINSLQSAIQDKNAVINCNFKQCPSIFYLPAYLESILHNLLSNALKYCHPNRECIINCETKTIDGSIFFTIRDNGLGIDLEKNGENIFGIYQTFHQNADAQGLGLFITRNQIEALGGNIKVESVVGIGTKFIAQLV